MAHLVEASIEVALFHLEFRNAVAQESAETIRALEDDDVVTGTRELLCDGEACRTGSDDGDALAGLHR